MSATSIDLALAAYQQPARLRLLQSQAAGPDILMLIKIAAGDAEATTHWAAHYAIPEATLLEASVFYLRSMIAAAGSDPYKLLCLKPGATLEDVNIHKRWLLRWLHPDRNGSAWESGLFTRVATAARTLERHLKTEPGAAPIVTTSVERKPVFDHKRARFTHMQRMQQRSTARHTADFPVTKPKKRLRFATIATIAVIGSIGLFTISRLSLGAHGDFTFANILWRG
ncbi:J domain-containing protein [Aestuariivirga litoralis]|uniref:J domain-containing protein n=1 Tax=Aestuariivirga litoralis TaxID=2650924 RepID=UPI0018C6206C|nr:J domain-containing protein [Aestuariivirga litoralis]MBG1233223.1 J domain-containing protein [Aestuariivirga litoralis]